MKTHALLVILFSIFLLASCSDKEKETAQTPELQSDKEEISANTELEDEPEVQTNNWCLPSKNKYGTLTYITVGLKENYLVEGRAYTVCEETITESGKLNSHTWSTQDNKVIKEYRLDIDDKYGWTTNWINEQGQSCVRIEKEGVDSFLQCR